MKQLVIKIPGKIMLSGEYAVLSGEAAVSSTIKKYLKITISQSNSDKFVVLSNIWKDPVILKRDFSKEDAKGSVLLETISLARDKFDLPPLQIAIDSEMDITHGFGSSSAIRLGILLGGKIWSLSEKAALSWKKSDLWKNLDIVEAAFLQQKRSQHLASGYDIATQALGGLVCFWPQKQNPDFGSFFSLTENVLQNTSPNWPFTVARLGQLEDGPLSDFIHVFVGGKGSPTGPNVNLVTEWLEKNCLWKNLRSLSRALSHKLIEIVKIGYEKERFSALLQAVTEHQDIFSRAPNAPLKLENTLKKIDGYSRQWSYKTTGAGGEDSILVFGQIKNILDLEQNMKEMGWHREKNIFLKASPEVEAKIE